MIKKHTAPQGGEAAALPANCANCRDNFPLPAAMDYFDRIVIADYTLRRTACTAVPNAEKPCLQPAAHTAAPTLADFANWLHNTQLGELKSMNETLGGDAYSAHLNRFIEASAASRALRQFNSEPRTSATTPATSASKTESAA